MLICKPAAMINGTVYMYGGQAKTSPDQKENTWSKLPTSYRLMCCIKPPFRSADTYLDNNFVALDLTKSWDTYLWCNSP